MAEVVASVYRFLATWPDANRYTVAALGMAFFGFLLNVERLAKAVRVGRARQKEALKDLEQRLRLHINQPSLLTLNHVRSCALELERRTGCSRLTDPLLCEVIRSIAFDMETYVPPSSLKKRREHLSAILRALGDSSPPLHSIAMVDRLYAYWRAQPLLVLVMVLVVLWTTTSLFPGGPDSRVVVAVLAVGIESLLILGTIRAVSFWTEEMSTPPIGLAKNHSRKLVPGLDLFLIACTSRSAWTDFFWHELWAPIWEHRMYMTVPRDRFMLMHRVRYPIARKLYRQLRRRLRKHVDRQAEPKEEADLDTDVREICRRLWELTGDSHFLDAARMGHRADLETSELARLLK